MTPVSIAGLLFAAVLHAIWNLLAKRGSDNQLFLISAAAMAAVFIAPLALVRATRGASLPSGVWPVILISGTLEALYYLLLGQAYRTGDLSLVYPISRGSSPLFVTLFALIFEGERIALIGAIGIFLTVVGIYVVHLKSFVPQALLEPVRTIATSRTSQLALLTGATIAGYSVADKAGVALMDPVLYFFLVLVVSGALLAPYVLTKRRAALWSEWQKNWRAIIMVGVTIGFGYLLILFILTTNKVSYATSVRTASVVFGAALGALVLKEPIGKKVVGACVIFAGIICIGLAN